MNNLAEFTGTVRVHDDVALVTVAGALDLYSAPLFSSLLQEAVAAGTGCVVVDMALVSFCDAGGLGLLVKANNQLLVKHAQLSIRAAPLTLRTLLAITGLDDALHLEPASFDEGLLAADLAAVARLPLTRAVLDAALKLVVVMSQAVTKGADGVSITLPRDGRLRTVAASNDVVLQMDHDQYDTGQGPCLDAATHGAPYSSTDLESESRWPNFVPRARSRGIESIMSTPLLAADRPLGALNVYSRAPDALASHEQQWATQFAQEASTVLLAADATATLDSVDAEILDALRSREVIAVAQGVIMVRQSMSADAAYRFLTGVSRHTSRPLLEICQEVVNTNAHDRRDHTTAANDVRDGPA